MSYNQPARTRDGKLGAAGAPISIPRVGSGCLLLILELLSDIFWVCLSHERKNASGGEAVSDPRRRDSPLSLALTR